MLGDVAVPEILFDRSAQPCEGYVMLYGTSLRHGVMQRPFLAMTSLQPYSKDHAMLSFPWVDPPLPVSCHHAILVWLLVWRHRPPNERAARGTLTFPPCRRPSLGRFKDPPVLSL